MKKNRSFSGLMSPANSPSWKGDKMKPKFSGQDVFIYDQGQGGRFAVLFERLGDVLDVDPDYQNCLVYTVWKLGYIGNTTSQKEAETLIEEDIKADG